MTDKTDRCTAASFAGCVADDDTLCDEEDFDALLAASSFGSGQARAIRDLTTAAAREHARRVLDGEEERAPVEGGIDDAVSGLVYGLARGVVPGPTVLVLDVCTLSSMDFLTVLAGGQAPSKLIVLAACQTSVLWPDHRAHLLQALIDRNAFADLRPDVAWNIVDWAFDVPRPPRVLRQCVALAVEQIDVSALAVTWLPSIQGEPIKRPCLPYLTCHGGANYRAIPEHPGRPETAKPALEAAPTRAALTAGSSAPATTVQTSATTAKRHTPHRARARRHPPQPAPHAAARRRKPRIAAAAVTAAAVIAAVLTCIGMASSGTGQTAKHAALAANPESSSRAHRLGDCPILHTGYPRGGCVAQLQTELNIIEGDHLHVDGIFGSVGSPTYQAVIAFQGAHGLKPDGMVDPATKQALDAALSVPTLRP